LLFLVYRTWYRQDNTTYTLYLCSVLDCKRNNLYEENGLELEEIADVKQELYGHNGSPHRTDKENEPFLRNNDNYVINGAHVQ